MINRICIYVGRADLINALDRLSSIINDYNFLFVKLDSADFFDFHDYSDDVFYDMPLDSNGERVYIIEPEGMWVKGEFVRDLVMSKNFAPRFNATYIFDKSISRCSAPSYSDTSECVQFKEEEALPQELSNSVNKLNACGYVSDGAGLNVLLVDKRLVDVWTTTDWGEGNEEIN